MERRYYLRGLGIGIAVTAVIMGVITSRGHKMTDREIIARAKELGMVENTVLLDGSDRTETEDGIGTESTGQDAVGKQNPGSDVSGGQSDDESAAGKMDMEETGKQAAEDGSMSKDMEEGADASKAEGKAETGEIDKAGNAAQSQETDHAASSPERENTDPTEDAAENGNSDAVGNRVSADEEQNAKTGEAEESKPVSGKASEEDNRELITSAAVKTITINSGDGSHTVAQKLADAGVVTSAANFDTFLCQNGYDKKLRTGTFSIPADASDEQIARIVTGAE